jgi:hypothetical protein
VEYLYFIHILIKFPLMKKQIMFCMVLMIICEAKIALLKAQSDAYADIEAVLGKGTYEVPDCGHPVKHIHVTKDATLGINVFGFDLHVHEDDDRCIKKDR